MLCMLIALWACEKDTPNPPVSVDSMQFEGVTTTLNEGESINLSQYLVITPASVGDTVTVEWSSNNEEIATVSASGSVETLRAGDVTITAKAMDKTAQVKLTIDKVKIKEFTIPAHLEVYVGEKIKFPINDLKPKKAPLYRFEWEADNDGKIPTYSEGKWYLKADKEREYTLTVSVDDAEDAKCNVKFVKPSVSKLAFNPASYTVEAESSLSLKTNLVITPADGMDADTIKVAWSSSKETVATIDQNGKVQAIAAGKATITAKAGGKTATCTVEVTAKPAPEDPEKPEEPEKPDTPIDPSDPSDPENPNITQYTVSYNANGGNGVMSSVTVKENESITIANNLFTRPVYNFIGWNTKANGSGISYQSGASLVVTENVTLYAQWKDMTNGYEYVDLGLSVMWATTNIGAARPESYGNYYAWGETATKSEYGQDNYYIWPGSDLTLSDDAAHVNWDGNWRMPTKAEFEELRDRCTWEYMKISGTPGFNVKGPNGNSIFLPYAGNKQYDQSNNVGEAGYYWSKSSDDMDYRTFAYKLYMNVGTVEVSESSGCIGYSIRAVLPK